jgi:hypothetical protein
MNVAEMMWKIYDAINFITRPLGVPKRVVVEAAEAASNVIQKHLNDYSSDHYEQEKVDERPHPRIDPLVAGQGGPDTEGDRRPAIPQTHRREGV